MTKRIVVAVLAAVLVAAVVLPPVFGARARSLVEAEVAAIAESIAPYAAVEVRFDDWEVGWYSSTATVTVDLRRAGQEGFPDDIADGFRTTLGELFRLSHGPVLAGASPGVGWGSAEFVIDASVFPELQEFQDETGLDHVARLGVMVGLFGATTIGMDMPAFRHDGKLGGAAVDFAGLVASAAIADGGDSLDLDGELRGLGVTVAGMPMVDSDQVTWLANTSRSLRIPYLWLGGGRLDFARLTVSNGLFEMIEARVEGDAAVDGDLVRATSLYRVRELSIAGAQLDDVHLEVSVSQGADALARVMEAGYNADFREVLQLQMEMLDLLDLLVKQRFNFDIDRFSFEHESLPASASLSIEYRGDELPDSVELGPSMDFEPVYALISAKLNVAVHQELLRTIGLDPADAMVRVLAREGIVLESDDEYTLNVSFDNHEFRVNGEPFEPLQLLGLLGGV